jgi:glycine cleavage system regulatory protein
MPAGTQFTLDVVLTAAGATVAAGLIATIIQVLKNLPGLGTWLDAGHEAWAAMLISVVLVIWAYVATTSQPDLVNAFAAFLAWVNIAALSTKAHDAAPEGLRRALRGG